MRKKPNNYAYIDGANLHQGVRNAGWQLDYLKFRIWLSDKYDISKAYIFIGLVPKYKDLYAILQDSGYQLIFKEVVYDKSGNIKGNCDADLVLKATQDTYTHAYDKAVLVSSDGDYASLVKFLLQEDKLLTILSPAPAQKCSILLKRTNAKIVYLSDQVRLLAVKKEKAPDRD
jgi:uncharacterized LabA/DUF88 family protein